MTKGAPIALVSSGPTRPDLLLRLPSLLSRLGPVKAPTFQHSSRVCNALRHGFPVREWCELRAASAVLVSSSEDDWDETSRRLAEVNRSWKGVPVIWLGEPTDLRKSPLAAAGARLATACRVEASRLTCVVCGTAEAQRLLRSAGTRVVSVSESDVEGYRNGVKLIDQAIPQILELACRGLAESGLPTAESRAILEARTAAVIRLYMRTRRRPEVDPALRAWASAS